MRFLIIMKNFTDGRKVSLHLSVYAYEKIKKTQERKKKNLRKKKNSRKKKIKINQKT